MRTRPLRPLCSVRFNCLNKGKLVHKLVPLEVSLNPFLVGMSPTTTMLAGKEEDYSIELGEGDPLTESNGETGEIVTSARDMASMTGGMALRTGGMAMTMDRLTIL